MSEQADRDALAEVIDRADDRWQHGIGSGGYDVDGPLLGIPITALADAILASDWLAQRDRRVRAEALREAAGEAQCVKRLHEAGANSNGTTLGVQWAHQQRAADLAEVEAWLCVRADRIERGE